MLRERRGGRCKVLISSGLYTPPPRKTEHKENPLPGKKFLSGPH